MNGWETMVVAVVGIIAAAILLGVWINRPRGVKR